MAQYTEQPHGNLSNVTGGSHDLGLRLAALAFAGVWLGGVWLFAVDAWPPEGPMRVGMTWLLAVVPVILGWVLSGQLAGLRRLQSQNATLQSMVEEMRVTLSRPPPLNPSPAAAAFSAALPKASIAAALSGTAPDAQPALALGPVMSEPAPPLTIADMLRALHFPNGPEDEDGFRALRLGLTDHGLAKLIRSAQDVLTLLAQEGIFMDALSPDRPRPDLWRRFARGERGGALSGLGGVHDRSCLALTAARMRSDAVFRDAAHHFLRSFDKALIALEPRASDSDLTALSDTRTARAFMLLGRVTGAFDELRR